MTGIIDYLNFCMHVLVRVLMGIDKAMVQIPQDKTIHQLKGEDWSHHLSLNQCWCMMSELKLTIKISKNDYEQNIFYNGWTCDHYVSTVFVFCPDRNIPICCYNVLTVHLLGWER